MKLSINNGEFMLGLKNYREVVKVTKAGEKVTSLSIFLDENTSNQQDIILTLGPYVNTNTVFKVLDDNEIEVFQINSFYKLTEVVREVSNIETENEQLTVMLLFNYQIVQ